MNVKLKNIEILNAIQSIGALADLDLSITTSWNITKNTKKLESLFKTYAECEGKIIEKYAIKDENNQVKIDKDNQYKIAPKFINIFNKERNELLNCENEIDISMIKVSDLIDEENKNKIKPAILISLYFMIED